MGWLWTSTEATPEPSSTPPASAPHEPSSSLQPSNPSTPNELTPNPTNPSEPSPDLTAFLTALRPAPPTPSPPPTHPTTSSTPLNPAHIHSRTLSCRSAFDTAFYCASLGGQFTSLYRYGSLRSCSEQWSEFWFCVRTNRGGGADREERILKHEWARERERYGGRESSEDVWRQRGGLVRGAFGGDYWGAVEEERRREEEGKA